MLAAGATDRGDHPGRPGRRRHRRPRRRPAEKRRRAVPVAGRDPVGAAGSPGGVGGPDMSETLASTVEFYSLYPDVRGPEPASPDLRGAMQARAARVCAPMTVASGFGWYVYPPVDFAVRWDGRCAEWSLLEENEPTRWLSLSGGVTGRLPTAPDALRAAPERFQADFDVFDKYGGVPFIEADPHDGQTLEVITGVLARTPPGWWLLVRDVPNRPHGRHHQILEGMVETD